MPTDPRRKTGKNRNSPILTCARMISIPVARRGRIETMGGIESGAPWNDPRRKTGKNRNGMRIGNTDTFDDPRRKTGKNRNMKTTLTVTES